MPNPRTLLNELKWHHDALDEVTVVYVHRGAPGDVASFEGRAILDLGRSFVEVEGPAGGTMLPYHRIVRIERAGEVVWERRS